MEVILSDLKAHGNISHVKVYVWKNNLPLRLGPGVQVVVDSLSGSKMTGQFRNETKVMEPLINILLP